MISVWRTGTSRRMKEITKIFIKDAKVRDQEIASETRSFLPRLENILLTEAEGADLGSHHKANSLDVI